MKKYNINEIVEEKIEGEQEESQTGFDFKAFGKKVFDKATDVASRAATVAGRTIEGGIKGAKKGLDEGVLKGRTFNEFYDNVADPYLDALGRKINTTINNFFEGTDLETKYPSPNFRVMKRQLRGELYQLYELGKLVCEDKGIDVRIKSDVVEKIAGKSVKSVSLLERAIAEEVTQAATNENYSQELMQYHTQVLQAVKGKVKQVSKEVPTDKDSVAQIRAEFLETYKTELKQSEGLGNYTNSSGIKGAILFIGSRMLMGPIPAAVLTVIYAKKELDRRGVDLGQVWGDTKERVSETRDSLRERAQEAKESLREHAGEAKEALSEAGQNLRETGRELKTAFKDFYRDLKGN